MSALPPITHDCPPPIIPPAPVLLNYAETRRHWDRNVSYLLTIICISQCFLILTPLICWYCHFAYTGVGRGLPRGIVFSSLDYIRYYFTWAGTLTLLPLVALLISVCAFLMLTNLRWARRVMVPLAIAQLVTIGLHAVNHTIGLYSASSFPLYYLTRDIPPFDDWTFQYLIAIGYPLLLLLIVLHQQTGSAEAAINRRTRVSILWSVTVVACILFAIPTLYDWYHDFDNHYVNAARLVYGIILNEGLGNSLRGIGYMSGVLACFVVAPLLLYAWLKGPAGRPALLICAALLFISAIDPAIQLYNGLSNTYFRGSFRYLLRQGAEPGSWLAEAALLAAFALSLRMALSLAELREKLDTRFSPDAELLNPAETTPSAAGSP